MARSIKCSWQKIVPSGGSFPTERSSHGVSIISDTLYVFGGEHDARIPIDSDIYAINISKKALTCSSVAWHKINGGKTAPVPRIAHAQVAIGNKIYVFGGRQGVREEEFPLNDLHYFDVENKTWTEIVNVNGTFPSPRSFHRMISVGSSLFVFGGCGGEGLRLSDLHEFDTKTSTWIKHSNVRFKLFYFVRI